MRLARVLSAYNQLDPAIDQLAAVGELDLLQLDYRWPESWPLDANQRPLASSSYAVGFLQQLRGLHKTLYLNPRLHLITNAGGGNTIDCVESLGRFLCEHGDADLLVTAVRGENLLPRLEELLAQGLDLSNTTTGAPLADLKRPILSAQIQLGAGPFATALDEGSRIVVAGSYDLAAPFLAAGANNFSWSWDHFDALAGAAIAARLGPLPTVIELHNDGSSTLETSSHDQFTATGGGSFHHADVQCDFSALRVDSTNYGQLRIAGALGSLSSGQWSLPLIYDAGYCSTVFFELEGSGANELACPTIEDLRVLFNSEEADRRITIQPLQSVDAKLGEDACGPNARGIFVRVHCCSLRQEPCEQFVREIANFSVRRQSAGLRLSESRPVVQLQTEVWWTQVPREAIDVSVDTRPAKQWK